jgi:hypothetical protein
LERASGPIGRGALSFAGGVAAWWHNIAGAGVPPEPAPGVRGSSKHDPALDGEYAVIAISPSTAVAVLARQTDSTKSDFYFSVIHDRPRIVCAARCLLRELGPEPASA